MSQTTGSSSICDQLSIGDSIDDIDSCRSNSLTLYQFNENLYFGTRSSDQSERKCDCGHLDCSFPKATWTSDDRSGSIRDFACDQKCSDKLQAQLLLERLSRFQVLQTYASIKYILMISILISIADGLFILTYQQMFIRDLHLTLFRRKQRLLIGEYSRFVLFDEQRLRVATGSLYLINVFIQLIGLFGVNGDRLLITSSYAMYSIGCFLFTIGTYLPHRRLLISLCINCSLAILSTIFAIFIKKFKHIQFGQKAISI
jgi:hypothetical protein